jgi:hypothetical protein
MEATTHTPEAQEKEKAKAMEAAKKETSSLKEELIARVREYLEKIDDLVETREELLKYVRALEIMEEELESELEIRREQKKDENEIAIALARIRALKRMFLNKVEILNQTLRTIVNPNLLPFYSLLTALSDEEINEFTKEIVEKIRKTVAKKLKDKDIAEDISDDSDDFKRYFNGLMREEYPGFLLF